jgi:hypothetical protein
MPTNYRRAFVPCPRTIDLPRVDVPYPIDSDVDMIPAEPIIPFGPFQHLAQLHSGSNSTVLRVLDISNRRTVCLKIVTKLGPDPERKRWKAVQAELLAYKTIAESGEKCKFIMDSYGAFQDSSSWYFVMVSERFLPVAVPPLCG